MSTATLTPTEVSTPGAHQLAATGVPPVLWGAVFDSVALALDGFTLQGYPSAQHLPAVLAQIEAAERRLAGMRMAVLARINATDTAQRHGHANVGALHTRVTHADRGQAMTEARTAMALFGDAPNATAGAPGGSSNAAPGSEGTGTAGGVGGADASGTGASDIASAGGAAGGNGLGAGDDAGGIGVAPRVGAATGEAVLAGLIRAEHAHVITRALGDLPEHLTHEQRREVEQELVRQAQRVTPNQLRQAARRALAQVEPDPTVVDAHEEALLVSEEDQAYEKSRFWIRDNRDGTMTGQFTIPTLSGRIVHKVLQSMNAPRTHTGRTNWKNTTSTGNGNGSGTRADMGAVTGARTGNGTGTDSLLDSGALLGSGAGASTGTGTTGQQDLGNLGWKEQQLSTQEAHGRAFADLLQHLPTDHLHHKIAATLIVNIDLEALREQTRAATTETDEKLSAAQTRRIACEAGILPAVLSGSSLPLDLGTQTRTFTVAQRTALATTYRHCAAQDCDRPFNWCEIHHLKAWHQGGATNLNNAIPLCGYHHRLIDSPHHTHTIHGPPEHARTITFTPRR